MNNIIAAQLFIHKLKPLLEQNKVVFDPRNQKTKKFLLQEGMNTDDVFDYLKNWNLQTILMVQKKIATENPAM